jgi:hypothetical protein
MASCSHDEIETPEPQLGNKKVEIKLNTLEDFQSNLHTPRNDGQTYDATVWSDVATDSIGLAKTLVDWKQMNDTVANLKTDWKDKGIYVSKLKTVFAFGDYEKAGMPKIKANPENGFMPYSANESDSIAFKKTGLNLKVYRPTAGVYEIYDINDLKENLDKIVEEQEPAVVSVGGTLNLGNQDIQVLETLLDKIISSPNIVLEGKIEVAATTDSVAVNSDFIEKMNAVGGKIVANGSNALFVKEVKDIETLRNVVQEPAKVRTDISENFANVDIAIPNKIVYRDSGVKSHSDAAQVDFCAGIHSLPRRDANWKTKQYFLDTGNSEIEVRDETVLARISQPAVRGTAEYPSPDIYADKDPIYTNIFLDNTKVYSDSVSLAIHQRVRATAGRTKMRTTQTSSNNSWKIIHHNEEENMVTMSPDGKARIQCILLNISDARLPLTNPILAEHADLLVFPYEIDAMSYCFVVPSNVTLKETEDQQEQTENDRTVMKLIESNGLITISNRVLNSGGVGMLPERKSFFWITQKEYAAYVAAGKRAR